MARRSRQLLLPHLLAALAAASSLLLAASAAPPSPDAVSVAVPPGVAPTAVAFPGARRRGQHHVFTNTTDDADAEAPSCFDYGNDAVAEAPRSLHSDEADADADAEDSAQDRRVPFRRPSKAVAITLICFMLVLAAFLLVLVICKMVEVARDKAIRRARVHPLDEDAAGP